jgi:hypothetical protein
MNWWYRASKTLNGTSGNSWQKVITRLHRNHILNKWSFWWNSRDSVFDALYHQFIKEGSYLEDFVFFIICCAILSRIIDIWQCSKWPSWQLIVQIIVLTTSMSVQALDLITTAEYKTSSFSIFCKSMIILY